MKLDFLKAEAFSQNYRLESIPVTCLDDLKEEIELFKQQENLNGFQKWILEDLYEFQLPPSEFTIKSIIITATPHPSYALVQVEKNEKIYDLISPAMSDFIHTDYSLKHTLKSKGYRMMPARNLPLKRLAVKCGLAVYGRNNICYVEGMGSMFSFKAYFSDMPCDQYNWVEVKTSPKCTNCNICFKQCPTGAIREDRFLIDNEKCLSSVNEVPGDFPDWVPSDAHHCLYDCMKCQLTCPMNQPYIANQIGPIRFNQDETEILLSGAKLEEFSAEMKQKAEILGIDQWLDAMPRNIVVLMDSYAEG